MLIDIYHGLSSAPASVFRAAWIFYLFFIINKNCFFQQKVTSLTTITSGLSSQKHTQDFHDDRPFLKHELHERNDLIELVRLEKKNRPPARFFFAATDDKPLYFFIWPYMYVADRAKDYC